MASEGEARAPRIDCVLVAGGKYHDIDFARLELLKLLAEDPAIRVRVFEDYENLAAIEAADMIVSYTCDIVPSLPAQEGLKRWLERGGRWYALHGTSSILRLLDSGLWDAPRWALRAARRSGRWDRKRARHATTAAPCGHPPCARPQ